MRYILCALMSGYLVTWATIEIVKRFNKDRLKESFDAKEKEFK